MLLVFLHLVCRLLLFWPGAAGYAQHSELGNRLAVCEDDQRPAAYPLPVVAKAGPLSADAGSGLLLADAGSGLLLTDAGSGLSLADAGSGLSLADAGYGLSLADAGYGLSLADAEADLIFLPCPAPDHEPDAEGPSEVWVLL